MTASPYREGREPCRECARREAEPSQPWTLAARTLVAVTVILVLAFTLAVSTYWTFTHDFTSLGAGLAVVDGLLFIAAPVWSAPLMDFLSSGARQ